MSQYAQKIRETSLQLQQKITIKPRLAIILGTGLGGLADHLEDPIKILYEDIVHFPISTVQGHLGQLVFGKLFGKDVVIMQGRFHYYEGYSMREVVYPLYVFKQLGVEQVILTNACGAINEDYSPGDLVVIDDFINLVFDNPLIGINDDQLGPRFPDMSEPYSNELIKLAHRCADQTGVSLKQGVYGFFSGPYYETKAEIQAFKRLGCDLIGMSTVPETIAANHAGMKVLAIACATNMATGIQKVKHDHLRVVEIANKAGEQLSLLIEEIIKNS